MIRNELQGIRAIAVVAVLIFHFNHNWLPGGYLGVDAFFVLSGFLMAQILSRKENILLSDISLFYKRRINRVAPAALFVILISIPIALIYLMPFEMRDYSASLVGAVTSTMNIMIANKIGYFSPLADNQPLLHYWSLMVEMHFYLLIPWVFFWFRDVNKVILALSFLLIISFVYANYRSQIAVNDAYYLIASRAWEFIIGSLVFLLSNKLNFMKSAVISHLAPLVFAGYLLFFDSTIQHPSIYTLPFIISMVPILLESSKKGSVSELLSNKYLVYLGNISFSFYLWHNLFVFVLKQNYLDLNILHLIAVFVITVISSHLSYQYIETPFLNKESSNAKNKINNKYFYLLLIPFITTFGVAGYKTDGYSDLWKLHNSHQSVKSYELFVNGKKYNLPSKSEKCISNLNSFAELKTFLSNDCRKDHGKALLIIGDSHAIGVFRAIYKLSKENNIKDKFIIGLTKGSCKVYSKRPDCFFNDLRIDSSLITENFSKVIYVQRNFDLSKLNQSSTFLGKLADSVKLIWLGPRIEPGIEARKFVRQGCNSQFKYNDIGQENLIKINDILLREISKTKVEFVHAKEYDIDKYGDCSNLFWRDSNHWTQQGVDAVSKKLLKVMKLYD